MSRSLHWHPLAALLMLRLTCVVCSTLSSFSMLPLFHALALTSEYGIESSPLGLVEFPTFLK